MDDNNQKPRVEYSEFRRMLEEMRGNKENSAQDSDNELTNNIKALVIVTKELTKSITMVISGQRTAPMGRTPLSATLSNSNNPKIQSDEDQLEAIKREEEQTELLRIIARNTGYREKANPEKPEEYSGGLLSNIALAGVAVAGLFYGYFKTWLKVVKGLFDGITKVLKGAYELILPESLRKNISESFSRIGTFFSELGNKVKALFVFEEGSIIGKALTSVKSAFSSIGGVLGKIGEGISGTVKAIAKIPGMSAFLKIAGTTLAFATGVGEIIAIAITIYDTIDGAIEGWKKGGFVGAITGALQGLIGGFVGGFADFIKWVSSGLLGMLGFKDAEKWLDSFSFKEMINDFIEAVMSPLQLLQDVIMHPIESLKKLGGVISDVFSKITKVFDPVIEFFSGIGKSVVGMLEGIGIPEIGFTIPIIGKKVSIGPFYPFKSDAQKPVAPAETPAAKTAPEAADTKLASTPQNRAPAVAPAAGNYAAKMPAEQVANVAETRREILNTRKDASGMKPGETRTIVGGAQVSANTPEKASPIVETKGGKAGPNWTAALKDYDSSWTPADHLSLQFPGINQKFRELAKKNPPSMDDMQSIEIHEKMLVTMAAGEMERGKGKGKASPIVEKAATPIPGGGQTVDPSAQNYNAKAAGTETKAPAVATPIKAKTDTVEQTRMAARGMYQAGTKEEEAAKQKLEAFKAANPFDIKAKGDVESGYTPGKFTDPKKQKEYDALMDAQWNASDKKEKAQKSYQTADNTQEYKFNKAGQEVRNYDDTSNKKDILTSRFGYKDSDLLNADGRTYSISKINTAYDKEVKKDLTSPVSTPLAEGGKKPPPNALSAMIAGGAKMFGVDLEAAQGAPAPAGTGNAIEAKTGAVANSRDALTASGSGSSAIVNAPTTVNNTNQNTTVAKSPFRNEEGTLNKYYASRLGAY